MADHERQDGIIPKRREGREVWPAALTIFVTSTVLIISRARNVETSRLTTPLAWDFGSGLSVLTVVFLSAVLGAIVDRLCLIWEEKYHLETRYEGSWNKLLQSCFSGVNWNWLFPVAIAVIAFSVRIVTPVKGDTVVAISGGLLIVLLVNRVFNSNSRCQIAVSRILEENEKSVGNGLAWSYYFGYLNIILPTLWERIDERDWQHQPSSKKLFILLPFDCNIRRNIEDADDRITKEEDGDLEYTEPRGGLDRKYTNKLHRIEILDQGKTYYILVEYATTLGTLKQMNSIKAITDDERIDQMKLFCRTLERILKDPIYNDYQEKCELVIYDKKKLADQDKGLAGVIVEKIEGNARLRRPRDVQPAGEGIRDDREQQQVQEPVEQQNEQQNPQEDDELRHGQENVDPPGDPHDQGP